MTFRTRAYDGSLTHRSKNLVVQEEAMQASSREDRVERLQDSLRQLMTQDSLRQMMDGQDVQSIHSSTYTTSRNNVAEKTDAMRRRIEELEAILADQQVPSLCLYMHLQLCRSHHVDYCFNHIFQVAADTSIFI